MSSDETIPEKKEISAQRQQTNMYRERYAEIEDIEGIGDITLGKLYEGGIRTVETLSTSTVRELVDLGIGEDSAKKFIGEAQKAIHTSFITATEVLEMQLETYGLTTGCLELDNLMNPGLPSQSISEFYGEFGAGKSQMVHMLCVTTQLPKSMGGLDGAVLLIDTEGIFKPTRLVQIASNYPDVFKEPKDVLEKVIYSI